MTVEELLLDESFIDYCRNKNSAHREKWEMVRVADASQAKVMEEARELLQVLSPELTTGEVEAEVNKFRQQFISQQSRPLPVPKKRIHRALAPVGIAACAALITFFVWPSPGKSPEPLAAFELSTRFGERKEL